MPHNWTEPVTWYPSWFCVGIPSSSGICVPRVFVYKYIPVAEEWCPYAWQLPKTNFLSSFEVWKVSSWHQRVVYTRRMIRHCLRHYLRCHALCLILALFMSMLEEFFFPLLPAQPSLDMYSCLQYHWVISCVTDFETDSFPLYSVTTTVSQVFWCSSVFAVDKKRARFLLSG